MESVDERKHVVLLGYPSFGHMIPLLALARKIVAQNVHTTVASSQVMLDNLKQRELISAEDEHTIAFVSLYDEIRDADLDTSVWTKHWTHTLPAREKYLNTLSPANGSVSQGSTTTVNMIILDMFLGKLIPVANKRGIPCYVFSAAAIGIINNFMHVTEETPVMTTPPRNTFLPSNTSRHGSQSPIVPVLKTVALDLSQNIKSARGIIVNSFRNIEENLIEEMKTNFAQISNMEFYCVGPLVSQDVIKNSDNEMIITRKIQTWLDGKPPRSVIYISFGSIALPNPAQINEIGKTLLQLRRPFIYSLRANHHDTLPEEIRRGIRSQFDNSEPLGLVVNWAPQNVILAHPAVQVFVTHCGWNSSTETVYWKKPVVAWPVFGDQMDNAEWLVNHGMGVLVTGDRNNFKPFIQADHLGKTIEEVAGWRQSEDMGHSSSYINAAQYWGERVREATGSDGSSEKEFLCLLREKGVKFGP